MSIDCSVWVSARCGEEIESRAHGPTFVVMAGRSRRGLDHELAIRFLHRTGLTPTPSSQWTFTSIRRKSCWQASVSRCRRAGSCTPPVSYTHLRAHETDSYLVCRLLLEKKKQKK